MIFRQLFDHASFACIYLLPDRNGGEFAKILDLGAPKRHVAASFRLTLNRPAQTDVSDFQTL